MKLTRFYRPQNIDLNAIDAVRTIFAQTINDPHSVATYELLYPSQDIVVDSIDAVQRLFAREGKPAGAVISRKNAAGRYACFDASRPTYITVEYFSKQLDPEKEIGKVEERLALERVDRIIRSAFIAHGFDAKGEGYAARVSEFLGLIGIEAVTGKPFEPKSVSHKVRNRIEEDDGFLAIATPQNDHTWLIQETAFAEAHGKHPFVLIEDTTTLKSGLLGDREHITFADGQIAQTFVPILQGLRRLERHRTAL